jgi:hypothetical protein
MGPLLIAAAVVAAVCCGFWYVLARWLKVQLPQRGCAATALPIIVFAAFLWIEGSPFNAVFAVIFLPPATLLCLGVVLLLEWLTAERID